MQLDRLDRGNHALVWTPSGVQRWNRGGIRSSSNAGDAAFGTLLRGIASACGLACVWGVALGNDPTAVGVVGAVTDIPLEFSGFFIVSNAKAHTPPTSIQGEYKALGATANWKFFATHDAAALNNVQATDVVFKLRGEHSVAPHAGEAAPNPLPEIKSKPVTVRVNRGARVTNWAGVLHPGAQEHVDVYRFDGTTTLTALGATATLATSVEVTARHGDYPTEEEQKQWSCVAWTTPAQLVYDAGPRVLMLMTGPISVLDRQGCASGGIDPVYGGDPLLGAVLQVLPVQVGPMHPDGSFPTGPGELHLLAPSPDRAELDARIAPGRIRHASGVRFFLPNGTILNELGESSGQPASRALADFAAISVTGHAPATQDSAGVIALTIEGPPGFDVIAATEGFSISATLPVSIFLSAVHGPAAPACDSVDFNNDGIEQDPTDIEAFLSVYSGGPCIPSTQVCNDIDFNNDGIEQDPTDIEAFLSVYSGGPCL